uniref:Uncharacterized protein n=1 Tax=Percolomonas cosmopolitus TaxID=63605 RepID=A0A7S1KN51_9EUKA
MPNRQKDKTIEEKRYVKNGVEVGRKKVESKQKNVVDSEGNIRTVESRKVCERGDTTDNKSLGEQIKEGAQDLVDGIKNAFGAGGQKNDEGEVVMRETVVKKK